MLINSLTGRISHFLSLFIVEVLPPSQLVFAQLFTVLIIAHSSLWFLLTVVVIMTSITPFLSQGSQMPPINVVPSTIPAVSDETDFARLTPINRLARQAFHEVADRMNIQPGWRPHARKFMHISNTMQNSPNTDPQWTGYYRFNMDILPLGYPLGWIAGIGRDCLELGGVDLQLACTNVYGVSGRHGRFSHSEDRFFQISSKARLIVLNRNEKIRDSGRVFSARITHLAFGNLAYTLVFRDVPQYREQLSRVSTDRRLNMTTLSYDPTPAQNDYALQDYVVKNTIAYGSTWVVSAGVRRVTGKAVAIKKMTRTPETSKRIHTEVEMLKSLRTHVRYTSMQ
jgi:hypothetical protein